jgi:hypothetical protein
VIVALLAFDLPLMLQGDNRGALSKWKHCHPILHVRPSTSPNSCILYRNAYFTLQTSTKSISRYANCNKNKNYLILYASLDSSPIFISLDTTEQFELLRARPDARFNFLDFPLTPTNKGRKDSESVIIKTS